MALKTFPKLHSTISNLHQLLTWWKVHVFFEIYKIQNLLFIFGQVQSKCKHWSSTNYITYLKLITVMHIAWNITYRKKVGVAIEGTSVWTLCNNSALIQKEVDPQLTVMDYTYASYTPLTHPRHSSVEIVWSLMLCSLGLENGPWTSQLGTNYRACVELGVRLDCTGKIWSRLEGFEMYHQFTMWFHGKEQTPTQLISFLT